MLKMGFVMFGTSCLKKYIYIPDPVYYFGMGLMCTRNGIVSVYYLKDSSGTIFVSKLICLVA
jgi:hypothetical protein